MLRIQLFNCMLVFAVIAYAGPAAAAGFPQPHSVMLQMNEEEGIINLANAAVKDPDGRELKTLLASLNAAGGIPFCDERGRYVRVKLTAAQLGDEVLATSGITPNRGVSIFDLEGNGSRYLLFAHNSSPVTGAATIWRKSGNAWERVFISNGDPAGMKRVGKDIEFVFTDICIYARASFSTETKTFTGIGYVDKVPGGSSEIIVEVPDDAVAVNPTAMVAKATWPSLALYQTPDASSKKLAQVPVTGAVWKLATKGDWMLVLVRQAIWGEWAAAYAGKGWRPGWMKDVR